MLAGAAAAEVTVAVPGRGHAGHAGVLTVQGVAAPPRPAPACQQPQAATSRQPHAGRIALTAGFALVRARTDWTGFLSFR